MLSACLCMLSVCLCMLSACLYSVHANVLHLQYSLNSSTAVNAGDLIGWTNEGNVGPISFQYVASHRTYFSTVNLTSTGVPSYPSVGTLVPFDEVYLPSMFSVAVELESSKHIYFLHLIHSV